MTINEKAFIISLIQEYSKIHRNIDNYEDQLDRIESGLNVRDRGKLEELNLEIKTEVEKLATFRNVELEFWDKIEEKYGPGEFDPTTFEYKTSKNGNSKNSTNSTHGKKVTDR